MFKNSSSSQVVAFAVSFVKKAAAVPFVVEGNGIVSVTFAVNVGVVDIVSVSFVFVVGNVVVDVIEVVVTNVVVTVACVVGSAEGLSEGVEVGLKDGLKVGLEVGLEDGLEVGLNEGLVVGLLLGLGEAVGDSLVSGVISMTAAFDSMLVNATITDLPELSKSSITYDSPTCNAAFFHELTDSSTEPSFVKTMTLSPSFCVPELIPSALLYPT